MVLLKSILYDGRYPQPKIFNSDRFVEYGKLDPDVLDPKS